jgi:hypothetical protein
VSVSFHLVVITSDHGSSTTANIEPPTEEEATAAPQVDAQVFSLNIFAAQAGCLAVASADTQPLVQQTS